MLRKTYDLARCTYVIGSYRYSYYLGTYEVPNTRVNGAARRDAACVYDYDTKINALAGRLTDGRRKLIG